MKSDAFWAIDLSWTFKTDYGLYNDRYSVLHKKLKKSLRNVRWLYETVRFCHRVVPIGGVDFAKSFIRAVDLSRRGRFEPAEAFRLGLFARKLPSSELSRYVSRKKLTKLQEALNPRTYEPLTKDKGIFYRYCMAEGLGVPRLYAVFFKGLARWSHNYCLLKGEDDWQRFLRKDLPDEFVIKPVRSAYGKGLEIFTKTDKGFMDSSGTRYKATDIYRLMLSGGDNNGFVIQQRLKNHAELVSLSGTESLQTVRFISLIDSSGNCRILHAHLKPIVGEHIIDTFLDGLVGNVEAPVSLTDGVLGPANQITGCGDGIKTIKKHPKTRIRFEGFRLPFWVEACELVNCAVAKFLPIRTIGWDIALTPTGPVIVEANIWWDPVNQHGDMRAIFGELQAAV